MDMACHVPTSNGNEMIWDVFINFLSIETHNRLSFVSTGVGESVF